MRNAQLIRKARGLQTQANEVYGRPEGSLLECVNFEISKPEVLSKIRGRNRYGAVAAALISKLFEYRDRLFRFQGTTLEYDSDGAGAWSALSGSFSPPSAAHRLRVAEDRQALYFTTSLGTYRKATLADAPVRAGIHESLDVFLTKTGTGAGIFPTSAQVAYRITFGREDANKKKLEGAPSWREILVNSVTSSLAFANAAGTITVTHVAHGYATGDIIEVTASSDVAQVALGPKTITVTGVDTYTFAATGAGGGGTIAVSKKFNVALTSTVPTDIAAGDVFRVYRTEFSASDVTPPGDECFLVEEVTVTAGHVAAGFVSYTDSIDEALLGDPLYSNANEEGSTAINGRPPYSIDIAYWKGHVHFVGLRWEHALKAQMLTVVGLVDGTSSLTLSDGTTSRTYTFNTTENVATQTVQRFTSGTGAENVEDTMKSLCKVINRDAGQTIWDARYISEEDDAPGIVEIRRRTLIDTAHFLTCNNSTTSTKFTPNIPTSGQAYISNSRAQANGLVIAKFEQPDAVVPESEQPVGPENRAILRAIPLRDSLILVTKKGVYRMSGESDGASGAAFSIAELDPTVVGVAPDTWVLLNNAAYGLSTQGVVRVDESGVTLVSLPIEDELKRVFGFDDFESISFATSYEGDREYRLSLQTVSSDTVPTLTRVYNYVTQTWSDRDKPLSAGHVLIGTNTLYEAHALDLFVLQERKTFTNSGRDSTDEDIAVVVSGVGTVINDDGENVTQVSFPYSYTGMDFQTGFLFTQGSDSAWVEEFTEAAGVITATLDALLPSAAIGAATVSLPINSRARWSPEAVGNALVMKQFSEVQFYFEGNTARKFLISFSSDIVADETQVGEILVTPSFGWGEAEWGEFPWGDEAQPPSTPIRVQTPKEFQRCRALTIVMEHRRAGEAPELAGVGFVFRAYGEKGVRTPA